MENVDRMFLSALCQSQDLFLQFTDYLSEKDFLDPDSLSIFLCLRKLFVESGVDKITANKLKQCLSINKYQFSDTSILPSLFEESSSKEEAKSLFLMFKRNALIGRYYDSLSELRKYVQVTDDKATDIVNKVESEIISISSSVDNDRLKITELCKNLKAFTFGLAENPGQPGIDFGFPHWQSRTGGVRNSSVSFIFANMKTGKTQIALHFAKKAAQLHNLPVLYIDTELSEEDQKVRMVGMLAEVPYDIITSGVWKLSDADMEKLGLDDSKLKTLKEYRDRMHDDNFWRVAESLNIRYLSVPGLSFDEVIPMMRRWVLTIAKPDFNSKTPQCLLIYDYLKLANVEELRGGKIAEWQIHGLNYQKLHEFAKMYNIPIISFGQSNNVNEDSERAIAGAKRIGENVTSITLYKSKDKLSLAADPDGSHYLKIVATRHGAGTPGCYINLDAELDKGKFSEKSIGNVDFASLKEQQREMFRENQRNKKRKNTDDDEDDDE